MFLFVSGAARKDHNDSLGVLFGKETHNIRVVTLEGNPWFVTEDVCKVLGFTRHSRGGYSHHLHRVDSSEKTTVTRKVTACN